MARGSATPGDGDATQDRTGGTAARSDAPEGGPRGGPSTPRWTRATIRPGWARFAETTTADDVMADFDAQLETRRQTRDLPKGHNGQDSATTSEATHVADDQHDRAADEPVQYDDEPWPGEDSQLAFFDESGGGAETAEAADGTVQLSVREILARREAGEPLDLPTAPEPAEPEPTEAATEARPAAEDSLSAAYAAAGAEDVEDDPDATAFYDWSIEDLDGPPPGSAPSTPHPGPEPEPHPEPEPEPHPEPEPEHASEARPASPAPEAGHPSAIAPGAPLLGVVPDLGEDEPDGDTAEPDDDAYASPRRDLGPFPVEDDEPEAEVEAEPLPTVHPAIAAVPTPQDDELDDQDEDDFDSGDEWASSDGYDQGAEDEDDPEDDAQDQVDDDEDGADEDGLEHDEPAATALHPAVTAPEQDAAADLADHGVDEPSEEPEPEEHDDTEATTVVPLLDSADDDDEEWDAEQDSAAEPTGPPLVDDAWGENPPGSQEEQYWHDDEGLRWRSRDGGYIWFADDGQIWDAQNGEVLREAVIGAAAASAATTSPAAAPTSDADADADDATDEPEAEPADPAATAAMAAPVSTPDRSETPRERRTTPASSAPDAARTAKASSEIPDYVEYAPSGTRRRVLFVLWIAVTVLAVASIVWAVGSATQSARGVAITVTGLALGSWWLLLSWTPTTVALSGSTLRVSKGSETEEFDLHDPDLELRLGDDVDSRSWKATVVRPDGSELEIPAASVHPDEFVAIVEHHRRRM